MTDLELNEAVARKLGWKQCPKECQVRTMVYSPNNHWHYPGHENDYTKTTSSFDFSTSIATAWEIVEYLLPNFGVEIHYWTEYTTGKPECKVCITPNPGTYKQTMLWPEAATAPRAICEAFLKLQDMRVGTDQK